ncbi:hypothetical protein PC9H_000684 [Pleurotus ostreatus]|uniref:Uncharacterized protein n=1 Tax=Pleurotus ostreatus TaxID=5322 RepID=A0A8H7A911_PLEOS|nr:uncharacterized protein PC9H_000684 [Pleurotus ostreatus]KAF7440340.1 hypothetical protein PC9H_000684 [Pleurotus ostreatus]KAJ8700354.1 hypothetical protein PTI98_003385 [Pleurotus ostreatus]
MYIYYRIYDANGPIVLKYPLSLSNLSFPDNKYVGRIDSSKVVPPFNVKNLNLAIALREGYQSIFEAGGAELYTTSSQTALPNKQGLPEDAGLHLTNPVKLKFLMKFEKPQVQRRIRPLSGAALRPISSQIATGPKQGLPEGAGSQLTHTPKPKLPIKLKKAQVEPRVGSRFAGKWSYTDTGTSTHFIHKNTSSFTLRMTSEGTIVASSYERFTTTYTGFVYQSPFNKPRPLPPPDEFTYKLSDFKVLDNSFISFLRTDQAAGCSWRMSGSLSADGNSFTLIANPIGKARRLPSRVFQRPKI